MNDICQVYNKYSINIEWANKWMYMCGDLRNYPKSEMMILEVIIYNAFYFYFLVWNKFNPYYSSSRRFEVPALNPVPIILVETGK